jgi:hypothetical protein
MSPMQVLAICLNKIAKINSEIESIPAALVFKASIDNVDLLPTNPKVGDMYNITVKSIYGEPGMNVAWNGTEWDALGSTIDLSQYYTKTETDNKFSYKSTSETVAGTAISQNLTSNVLYIFSDELTSLNITGLDGGNEPYNVIREWMFQFTSGATPTVLTLPTGVQSELVVSPNTIYQCSIVNNLLTFQGWKVSS